MNGFILPQKPSVSRTCQTPITVIIVFFIVLFSKSENILPQQDEFSERIKLIENEIEKSEKELEKGEEKLKKLKSQEQKILSDLSLQNKNIENVSKNLVVIKREENSLKQNTMIAQRNYDEAMNNLSSRTELYAERIRSMYMSQKISPLELLFTSGSMSSVMRNFKMFTVIAKQDLEIVNEFKEKSADIKVTLNKLNSALNANISLAKIKKNEQLSLANSQQKQKKLLEDIKKNEELQEEANRQQQENIIEARAEIDRLISNSERDKKREDTVTPPSLKGYNFADHKGSLIWPVNGKIISLFGTITDSKTKTRTNNRGIEIETKHGEPVFTIGDGIVIVTQYIRGYGNFVLISHPSTPNDYYSIYGHLSDILVNKGDVVFAGDAVGRAGSTGMIDNSTSRLVLEILKGEIPVNPIEWLSRSNQRVSK
ncbi:murein hydrolase activator EnvC family protein [Candidatus Latescibacterota bacterium]